MQIQVVGRHMPVTDSIRQYAEEKVGKVARTLDREDMRVEVKLHVEKNPEIENREVAEITAFIGSRVVRAEEAATDMYAAIDLASDKFGRQVKKYKQRLNDRHNGRGHRVPEIVKTAPGDQQVASTAPEAGTVVKTKTIELTPMTEDEAILQLELLGHDFLMYNSADTGTVNVLYRRDDGDFGVLRPEE
jgi:ribosome hibernation promoting factor